MTPPKKPERTNEGYWNILKVLGGAFVTIMTAFIIGFGLDVRDAVSQVPVLVSDVEELRSEVDTLKAATARHDLNLQALEIRMKFYHRRGGVTPNE